jgi:aryl-phospho-beta-D-glucosidase BglC (GH1 family)
MRKMMTLLALLLFIGCGSEETATLQDTTAASAGVATDQPLLRALAENVEAEFVVQDDWGSGFVAQVTLTNNGDAEVVDWGVSFAIDRGVDSLWNALMTPQRGGELRFDPMDYNRTIAPGSSLTFGFAGSPGGVQVPAEISVHAEPQAPSDPQDPPEPPDLPDPPAPAALSAEFSTDSDWGAGMTGAIVVRNSGTTSASDWRVEFDFPANISSVWNAEILEHEQTRYVLGPVAHNQELGASQTVSMGFQAAPGGLSVTGLVAFVGTPPDDGPPPEEEPPEEDPPEEDPPEEDPPEEDPPSHASSGYLSTSGANIVDDQGRVVRLTGLNWFGLETETFAPHGLWARGLDSCLDQIADLGYNCLRIPYSNELFDPQSVPNGIDFSLNPQLQGLSGLEILDAMVEGAGERGMRVILDRHRPSSSAQSELWYTGQYDEERWISDWEMLALRYRDNPTVVGFDLHNEPHGPATWGTGDLSTDWRLAAQRAGNRILAVNPNLLILVEGVGDGYWWGGNLSRAGTHPVVLNVPGRVVYSPHDYPQSVYAQDWFEVASYPGNLPTLWDTHWGYLVKDQIAPVLLGEFGTELQTVSDQLWLDTLAEYVQTNGVSFTYWCFNPNSGDTGGVLKDDWRSVHQNKQAILAPLQAPFLP